MMEPNAVNRQTILMLEPGQTAPDFAVTSDTGTTVRLADFAGKNLVIWFYPRADTPG